jgi:hypothetical protein
MISKFNALRNRSPGPLKDLLESVRDKTVVIRVEK